MKPGWSTVALGELMPPRGGSIQPSEYPNETFDLYSIPAYDRGVSEKVLGSGVGSAKQLVRPGDVILSKIVPHIRRAWVVDHEVGWRQIASGEWIVFRDEGFDPRFLRFLLLSDAFHREFMKTVAGVGGSLLRARPTQVKKIEIPKPPLDEQRRIAAVLDHVDALRAKRREILNDIRVLQDSLVGVVADQGRKVPIGDIADFQGGLTLGPKRSEYTKEMKYLRVANVMRDHLELDSLKSIRVTDREVSRTTLISGDVLIVEGHGNIDEIGRSAVWRGEIDGDVSHQNHLFRLRPRTSLVLPDFLNGYINSGVGRRQIKSIANTTSGLNTISGGKLKALRIMLPELGVQERYSAKVTQLHGLRESAQRHLAELDTLFASLQSRAFSGDLDVSKVELPSS